MLFDTSIDVLKQKKIFLIIHYKIGITTSDGLTVGIMDAYGKQECLVMDFLIDGQISSFYPDQPGGEAINPNNATQTHSIFVKL